MPAKDLVFTILGIDKASDKFKHVGDSIDKMATRGTKAFALFAGAGVGSSLAVAGALAGAPLAVIGAGAAIMSQNAAVRSSFADLSQTVRTGLTKDATPLEGAFVHAAQQIGATFEDLRPELRAMFQSSALDVATLTAGVTKLARTAMPGLQVAVQQAGPVFDGLGSFLEDTGRGLDGFFTTIAHGAPAAGHSIASLGDLVESVLPDVAGLVVDLSDAWAEHSDQAVSVISRLIGVTTDLGSHALPVVSDAMGVALDVFGGALNVIGPIADELGPLIGLWLSLSTALKLVGGAQSVIQGVAGSVNKLRDGMSQAGGGAGLGRFATGLKGSLDLLGGPWGAAVLGAGVLLAMFGRNSEEAASSQRSLASSLRESGGEFDANARRTLANSDQYKKIAGDVEKAGLSHQEFIQALQYGGPRLDDLERRLRAVAEAGTQYYNGGQGVIEVQSKQAESASRVLLATDDLRSTVVGATEDFRREGEAVGGAAAATVAAVPGSAALREALKTLGDVTADTTDRADALNTAWRQLFGIQLGLEDATAEWEAGIDKLREQIDGVKHDTSSWRTELLNADGLINLTTESGRKLQSHLESQGQSYRALAQATYDTALRQGRSQQQATADAQAAVSDRRQQFVSEIGTLDLTSAQVDALTRRYLGLPSNVLTLIRADASSASNTISTLINRWDGSVVRVYVRANGDVQALNAAGRPVGRAARAAGGPTAPFQLYRINEQGEEIFAPRVAGMVYSADQAMRIIRELNRAPQPMLVPAGAAPGSASSAPPPSYSFVNRGVIGSQRELEDWLVESLESIRRKGRG